MTTEIQTITEVKYLIAGGVKLEYFTEGSMQGKPKVTFELRDRPNDEHRLFYGSLHEGLIQQVKDDKFLSAGYVTVDVQHKPMNTGSGYHHNIMSGKLAYATHQPAPEEAKPPLVQAAEAVGGQLVETVEAPASRPVTEGTDKDKLIVDQVLIKEAAALYPHIDASFEPEVAADMVVRMWNRIRERHLPPAEEESTDA
jgi:hypothetical protein